VLAGAPQIRAGPGRVRLQTLHSCSASWNLRPLGTRKRVRLGRFTLCAAGPASLALDSGVCDWECDWEWKNRRPKHEEMLNLAHRAHPSIHDPSPSRQPCLAMLSHLHFPDLTADNCPTDRCDPIEDLQSPQRCALHPPSRQCQRSSMSNLQRASQSLQPACSSSPTALSSDSSSSAPATALTALAACAVLPWS
jgi:hypothetical protein